MGECFYNRSVWFFYNSTGKELSPIWRTKDKLVVSLGLLVCVIIILANLLVIMAITINRRFHFPIFYLLANLAAADLFSGVAYMFLMFHTGPRTIQLSVRTWFFRQSLLDISLTASVANLLAIAVERHQTIFQFQLHSKMSNQRVTILIGCIWCTAILIGFIPHLGWNCICHLSTCSRMAPLYSQSYLIFWAVSNLVIFGAMMLNYLHIYYYVRQKTQRMSRHTSFQQRHKDTMMNLMKTVVMVLSAFVICWTPGLVVLLLDGVDCRSCDILKVEKYFLLLAELNSLINPLIYSYRDEEMLHTFRRILCWPCNRGSTFQDPIKSHILMQQMLTSSQRVSGSREHSTL
ncbi:lysophosphatidic acid receptor 2a [Stegostoma tigrinum]|uniref:lysophosphatidic acid receptor 2a n=1 Tax=Stegostoma tigrinum TaxID=3053191 RepID=UPI00202AF4F4|nr:lysophosphatidic acid receptor 2a [Stegostoma tigrinum]XP_048377979.1 lysophosphatidic acid receptor 2a [Stegostoma tigrinum]